MTTHVTELSLGHDKLLQTSLNAHYRRQESKKRQEGGAKVNLLFPEVCGK